MILPPFEAPKYAELRAWWRLYSAEDVRRLILEVQSQRYFLSELRAVVDDCRLGTENDRPLEDRMRQLNRLLRQIDREISRYGRIYGTVPTPHPNAPGFRSQSK